jgi:hypothetical protein
LVPNRWTSMLDKLTEAQKPSKTIDKMADKPVSRIPQTEFPICPRFCKLLKLKVKRNLPRRQLCQLRQRRNDFGHSLGTLKNGVLELK